MGTVGAKTKSLGTILSNKNRDRTRIKRLVTTPQNQKVTKAYSQVPAGNKTTDPQAGRKPLGKRRIKAEKTALQHNKEERCVDIYQVKRALYLHDDGRQGTSPRPMYLGGFPLPFPDGE